MNGRFNGKVAIVTGAASGIGRAVAERFFDEGAVVFAVDRNPETLAQLPPAAERWQPHLSDIAAKGSVSAPHCGLRGEGSAASTCSPTLPASAIPSRPTDTSDEDFDYWINANLGATFRLCRDALPELRKRRGNILNMASGLAIVGMAKQAAYTSAKAGIAGLTRQMAAEYGPQGIRVNAGRAGAHRNGGDSRAARQRRRLPQQQYRLHAAHARRPAGGGRRRGGVSMQRGCELRDRPHSAGRRRHDGDPRAARSEAKAPAAFAARFLSWIGQIRVGLTARAPMDKVLHDQKYAGSLGEARLRPARAKSCKQGSEACPGPIGAPA